MSLYEDEDFNVIFDAGPATAGHALILPKEHPSSTCTTCSPTWKFTITSGCVPSHTAAWSNIHLKRNMAFPSGKAFFVSVKKSAAMGRA